MMGKPMYFDGPKELKHIEKQKKNLFWVIPQKMKKYAKWALKSHVFGSEMVTWVSLVQRIL